MKTCIYCGYDKSEAEFSDEHIWPDALGGDFLTPRVWRTDDVCSSCNSMSGVFVDGAFIRSWIGCAERSTGAMEFLSPDDPTGVLPLNYLGVMKEADTGEDEIAEYWAGPLGAQIVHIRPSDKEEHWGTYPGGDPRVKKSKAGRAYMTFTSEDPFWIQIAINSFKAHFKRATRVFVNAAVPPELADEFKSFDVTNPVHAADKSIIDLVRDASRNSEYVKLSALIKVDMGQRFMAKLGLALGYKLLGSEFLKCSNAINLRKGFREANFEKRKEIPISGAGFLQLEGLDQIGAILLWRGGWVLWVKCDAGKLSVQVVSPSGKTMLALICDEPELLATVDPIYHEHGVVWITVPPLSVAVGPIGLPEYLAHRTGDLPLPKLTALDSRRGDINLLPTFNSAS